MATAGLIPLPRQVFRDATGAILVGASVYTYINGTATPKSTWQDPAATVLNTNPIITDSAGSAAIFGQGAYTLAVYDADSTPVSVYDGYTADPIAELNISTAMLPVVQASTVALAAVAMNVVQVGGSVTTNTFLPTGASQIRTLAAWGADVTNAKFLGAKGDGTTDDTAALQAAIDKTGNIYIPPGTYITDTLTRPSLTTISGAGMGATILKSKSGNPIFQVAATTSQKLGLCNLTLYGQNYPLAPGAPDGIGVNDLGADNTHRPSQLYYWNVDFWGFSQAISNHLTANSWFTNLYTFYCSQGLVSNTCADVDMAFVKVQNAITAGVPISGNSGFGFVIENDTTHGASDEGLRMVGCSTNGQFGGLDGALQNWAEIIGCSFTTCANNACVLAGVTNWQIIGGEFSAVNGFAGIDMAPGSGPTANAHVTISGAFFALNTFGVIASGNHIVISNNKFTANTNVDIQLQTDALRCNVGGNICASTGAAQSINESGSADYNLVMGNSVAGTIVLLGAHSSFSPGVAVPTGTTGFNLPI